MILVRVELNLDVNGVSHSLQHGGGLGEVGHPQVDPAHLQQLVPHLQPRLVCQTVARH